MTRFKLPLCLLTSLTFSATALGQHWLVDPLGSTIEQRAHTFADEAHCNFACVPPGPFNPNPGILPGWDCPPLAGPPNPPPPPVPGMCAGDFSVMTGFQPFVVPIDFPPFDFQVEVERMSIVLAIAFDGEHVPGAQCTNRTPLEPAVQASGDAFSAIATIGEGTRTLTVYTRTNVLTEADAEDTYVVRACAQADALLSTGVVGLEPIGPTRISWDVSFAMVAENDHDVFNQPPFRDFEDPDYATGRLSLMVAGVPVNVGMWEVGTPPPFWFAGPPPLPLAATGTVGDMVTVPAGATSIHVPVTWQSLACGHLEALWDAQGIVAEDSGGAIIVVKMELTVFPRPKPPKMVLVPGGGPGPPYDFWIGQYEITNAEYTDFLNDAQLDAASPAPGLKSAHMVFDQTTGQVHTPGGVLLFDPNAPQAPGGTLMSKVRHRPHMPIGSRYMCESGFEQHAVVGVSWYGALKYCNWLTLFSGHAPSQRCYREGDNAADWIPATAPVGQASDLTPAQRAALVALKGYRLPMDNLGTQSGWISNQANGFNEWYKALAYDPGGPAGPRIGPGGETVPSQHWIYAFGRDPIFGGDANYGNSGDPFDDDTAPVGYFDGFNTMADGTLTNDTGNPWGLYDGSGNVNEWGQDHGPTLQIGPIVLATRVLRTGSWNQTSAQTAASYRQAVAVPGLSNSGNATREIGFRVLSTSAPCCTHDLNCDGVINQQDLGICLATFGSGCNQSMLGLLLSRFNAPCP